MKAETKVAAEVLADHTDPMDSYVDEDEEDVQLEDNEEVELSGFSPAEEEEVEIEDDGAEDNSITDMLADNEESDFLQEEEDEDDEKK